MVLICYEANLKDYFSLSFAECVLKNKCDDLSDDKKYILCTYVYTHK